MSFPIDDEFAGESQEDGRIKIITVVDGQVKDVGWRNPDGTSTIASEDGSFYYIYDPEGNFIGYDDGSGCVCVADEDYFYDIPCESCFTPNTSDTAQLDQSAQRLAETPPKSERTEERVTIPTVKDKAKKEKTDLPEIPERPVFVEKQGTHPAAPAATPPVVSSGSAQAGHPLSALAEASAVSAQHVVVSVEVGAEIAADPVVAERSGTAAREMQERTSVGCSDMSADGAAIYLAWQAFENFPACETQHDGVPAVATLSDPTIPARMDDQTMSVPMSVFSGESVLADDAEAMAFDFSDLPVFHRGEHVAGRGDGASSQQTSVAVFAAEGGAAEAEAAGVFVGAPVQLTARSEGAALQATMIAIADSAKQSVPNVDNQNPTHDQGNPNGNGDGENGDGQNQQNPNDDDRHQHQDDDEEYQTVA